MTSFADLALADIQLLFCCDTGALGQPGCRPSFTVDNLIALMKREEIPSQSICEVEYKEMRLIVSYSRKRAKADATRRQRSVSRLEKLVLQNKAVRKHKFLEFSVKGKPTLDYQAVEKAGLFDGLKGYLTNNASLTHEEVISHYNYLPTVEQSFRMTKSDLKIRPAFHQRSQRIEAHVVLCMVSLCVMRILEDKVKTHGFTYPQALSIISRTNSALIGNARKSHLNDGQGASQPYR